jgi:hypothetical protein
MCGKSEAYPSAAPAVLWVSTDPRSGKSRKVAPMKIV